MKFILDVNAYFLALRALMMPITAALPLMMLSRIGRCEGQVNWHEPDCQGDTTCGSKHAGFPACSRR